MWDLPGGHIEHGESELDALAREMQEELGVQIATSSAFHLCRLTAGSEEHDESQWFRPKGLPDLAHGLLTTVLVGAIRTTDRADMAA